jgi:hypothetical protein
MKLTLVLVHLGSSKCEHLWANAERIKSIWPELEIWMILDDLSNISIATSANYNVFNYSKISKIRDEKDQFRNGFWNLTRERILALFEFHSYYPEKQILHIENDILLLRNFPLHYFEKMELNTWLQVSEDHDSAAIIYLPSIESSEWLKSQFMHFLSSNNLRTDMQILSEIRRNNPNQVSLLPTLDHKKNFENGYFDSAAVGMWITGEEPRNNFGFTRRFNNRFNIEILSNMKQPFMLNQMNLEIANSGNKSIYNLHIHSKNLNLLGKNAEHTLAVLLKPSSKHLRRYSFSIKILVEIINEYHKRGKLLSLVAALPIIRQIRKLISL